LHFPSAAKNIFKNCSFSFQQLSMRKKRLENHSRPGECD
jgi:hypothetical protein